MSISFYHVRFRQKGRKTRLSAFPSDQLTILKNTRFVIFDTRKTLLIKSLRKTPIQSKRLFFCMFFIHSFDTEKGRNRFQFACSDKINSFLFQIKFYLCRKNNIYEQQT